MLNQVMLVGRLRNLNPVVLEIPRPNMEEGSDIVEIDVLNKSMQDNISDYCEVGCLIGIRGKVRRDDTGMKIQAEKVTMLTTKGGEK